MIIIDINQVMIANIMAQLGNHTNTAIEEDIVRHMVLNTLRSIRRQFKDYGKIIIACDDKKYWRKQQFPHYKSNRKKVREQSEIDWNQVFNCLNTIKNELKENAPYKVLQVDGAEADDIIATLVIEYGTILASAEKILILSGDKDFLQLQVYGNVEQYNPIQKKAIKHSNPHKYLREHILKGDRGDGIPNILSPDACFVNGERQKPLTTKRIEYLANIPDLTAILPEDQLNNFKRNESLIDLHMIPTEIQQRIMNEYHNETPKSKEQFLEYFKSHNLKSLTNDINEF
jgi:5'-3' exonuclease